MFAVGQRQQQQRQRQEDPKRKQKSKVIAQTIQHRHTMRLV